LLDDLPPPIPTDYYTRLGEAQYHAQPMASSPFKFVSRQINQGMTFDRFDGFWDSSRQPNFKTLKLC
jgi:ABC-type transport system substrate-binding protein